MLQRDLGQRINCSMYTVHRYESGAHGPRLEVLLRLRRTLRVTLEYLVTGARSGQVRDARLLALFQEIEELPPQRGDELIRLLQAFLDQAVLDAPCREAPAPAAARPAAAEPEEDVVDPAFRLRMGKRIRALRRHHRLTQRELGRRVGCSEYTVHRYERGEHSPGLPVLLRLRRELRTSLDYLLLGLGPLRDTRLLAALRPIEHLPRERCAELTRLLEACLSESGPVPSAPPAPAPPLRMRPRTERKA